MRYAIGNVKPTERTGAKFPAQKVYRSALKVDDEDALAEKPTRPFLTLRAYCAFHLRQEIPESIQTEAEAIAYAACVSKKLGMSPFLSLGKRKRPLFLYLDDADS